MVTENDLLIKQMQIEDRIKWAERKRESKKAKGQGQETTVWQRMGHLFHGHSQENQPVKGRVVWSEK